MAVLNDRTKEQAASVARDSYGRLVALLASRTGDIASAEDALADAFERALTHWPMGGIPDNPEAWLLTVARNRQRDRLRSSAHRTSRALDPAASEAAAPVDMDVDVDAIPDHRLALLFVCAHPAIDPMIRTPLMLQAVLGFRSEQIAAAFAMPASAMTQRLVRAKRRIRGTGIPFAVPDRSVAARRMPEVLEAVYGAYAIDWQGIAGATERGTLEVEALHLAETVAELAPGEPEALGLAALICLSLARAPARLDSSGALVPLHEQDTSRWDRALIERGERYLLRAHELGHIGRFQLEAAIQSAHSDRRNTGITDWSALRTLHTALVDTSPTLGARVALAVVIGETDGPAAGLLVLDDLDPRLANRFQPAWAARAHLLAKAGDTDVAAEAFDRAISLSTDPAARTHLRRQRDALDPKVAVPGSPRSEE